MFLYDISAFMLHFIFPMNLVVFYTFFYNYVTTLL